MSRVSTLELRNKEVVNISDGVRLGYPSDFEFNVLDGRISALIVPRGGGFLGFFHGDDIVIPWRAIECIGEDAILVRLDRDEYLDRIGEKRKKSL